jgi:predicted phosphodiesterase
MRVAALYDIHGNLPALEAVLEEIQRAGVDQIVVGGDVVPGPMPRETLARLLEVDLPIQFIYGNGEVAVLDEMAGKVPRVPPQFRDVIRWNAQQLADYKQSVASWPKTVGLHIPELGDLLFCHATPQNENDIFTKLTPEERLSPIFKNIDAAVVVCGHTHMQFDRMIGPTRVVNAGSVGCHLENPAPTGCCLVKIFSSDEQIMIYRKPPNGSEARIIRKRTSSPTATSCSRRPRCWECS